MMKTADRAINISSLKQYIDRTGQEPGFYQFLMLPYEP
jgi:hypothetical protein